MEKDCAAPSLYPWHHVVLQDDQAVISTIVPPQVFMTCGKWDTYLAIVQFVAGRVTPAILLLQISLWKAAYLPHLAVPAAQKPTQTKPSDGAFTVTLAFHECQSPASDKARKTPGADAHPPLARRQG
jgi:hypothetical protein